MKSVGIGKKEIAEKAKKSGIAIDRRIVGGNGGRQSGGTASPTPTTTAGGNGGQE